MSDARPTRGPAASGRPAWRGLLHLLAAPVAAVGGAVLVTAAPPGPVRWAVIVYAASLVLLFAVSATYHRRTWGPRGLRIMRRADHSAIYVLIAGTYTGIGVPVLDGALAWGLVGGVWAVALGAAGVSTVLAALGVEWGGSRRVARILTAVLCVGLGWAAILAAPVLVDALGWTGLGLMLAGGIAYSVGAWVYAARRPDPAPRTFGYHEVFHALTLVGAGLHMAVVAGFALPAAG